MPYPKKYSDAQVLKWYEKHQQSDLDLKTWCEQHTPPLMYKSILARFNRLEKRLAKGGLAIRPAIHTPTATNKRQTDFQMFKRLSLQLRDKTITEESYIYFLAGYFGLVPTAEDLKIPYKIEKESD